MTTDNTQELDEILAKHNGELGVTWEDPDVVTPDTKQALIDWHNKQTLELLDRLLREYELDIQSKWFSSSGGMVDLASAIEAERDKLKGSKNDQL